MATDPHIEAIREELGRISEVLDKEINKGASGGDRGLGYALLVFPHGASEAPNTTAFIASGSQNDITASLARILHLLLDEQESSEEGGDDEPGEDDSGGETVH